MRKYDHEKHMGANDTKWGEYYKENKEFISRFGQGEYNNLIQNNPKMTTKSEMALLKRMNAKEVEKMQKAAAAKEVEKRQKAAAAPEEEQKAATAPEEEQKAADERKKMLEGIRTDLNTLNTLSSDEDKGGKPLSGQPPSVRSLLEELDKAEQSMNLEGDKSTDRPKSPPEVIAGNPDEVLRLRNIAGMTNARSADEESEATLAPPEQIDTSWEARTQRMLARMGSAPSRPRDFATSRRPAVTRAHRAGNPDEVPSLRNTAGIQHALEEFKSNSEGQKKAGGRRIKSKKRKSPKRKYKKRKSHKRKSKRRSKRR